MSLECLFDPFDRLDFSLVLMTPVNPPSLTKSYIIMIITLTNYHVWTIRTILRVSTATIYCLQHHVSHKTVDGTIVEQPFTFAVS